MSFAPPPRQSPTPLPFSFTPLRPEELEECESVTELGKLAASYLNQPDRYGSEPSDTPPRLKETNTPDRAPVIASILSNRRTINSEHCEPEPLPAFEFTVPESRPHSRQAQSQDPQRFKINVQRTSTSVRGTLKKKPRPRWRMSGPEKRATRLAGVTVFLSDTRTKQAYSDVSAPHKIPLSPNLPAKEDQIYSQSQVKTTAVGLMRYRLVSWSLLSCHPIAIL